MGGCREAITDEIIGVLNTDCKRRVLVVVRRVKTYVFWECVLQENVVFHWHRHTVTNRNPMNSIFMLDTVLILHILCADSVWHPPENSPSVFMPHRVHQTDDFLSSVRSADSVSDNKENAAFRAWGQDWNPDSQTQKFTTQLDVKRRVSGRLWLTLSLFFKSTASHLHDFITCFSSERSFLLLCAWRNKGKQIGKTCRHCNGSHQYRDLI